MIYGGSYYLRKIFRISHPFSTTMSQGTLYANEKIRTVLAKAVVKHLNLDVKIVDPANDQATYDKYFPTGKYPAFVGPKGLKLTEVLAIVLYCMYYCVPVQLSFEMMRKFLFIQLSLS